MAWADETTEITFSEQGYENGAEVTKVSVKDVELAFDKGTNSNVPKYYTSGNAVRVYGGGSMTVSVSSGYTITKIDITFGSSDGSNAITTDPGTYNNGTWEGSASSVKFTVGGTSGNRRFSAVKVTYTNSGTTGPVTPNVTFASDAFEIEVGTTATNEITKPADLTVAYSINPAGVATIDAETGAVTGVAAGTATVTAAWDAVDGQYTAGSKTYTLTVVEPTVPVEGALFQETFDRISGTGGRDNVFSGSIATSAFKKDGETLTDETDWTIISCGGGSKCAKYGTSSADGILTTRAIALTGDGTLTFSAAGWASGTNSLKVTATGGTLSGDVDLTLENSTWKDYTVAITGATGELVLTFTGKRGFIDDIVVIESDKKNPGLVYETTSVTVELGKDFTAPTLTNPNDLTVSYSSSDENVATVAGDGTVTIKAEGTTTITATFAGNDNYNEGSASYTLKVIDPNKPGASQENPYTVAQARAAIDAGDAGSGVTGVYAKGIVSEIVTAYSSQYGNITYNISDDGTTTADQLQAYRGKSYNGANFTSADDIQVGDVVVIYGNLTKHGSTTYEFDSNNQLVSLERENAKNSAGLAYSAASFTAKIGEENAFPTLSNPNGLAVTYESSNTDVATVAADGTVTLVAKGETTITAKSEETDDYYAGEASYKLTVKETKALVTVDEEGNTTFDLTDNGWGFPEGSSNKTVDEGEFSNVGYTIKVAGNTGNGYYFNTNNTSGYLLMGKTGAYLTLPAFDFDVEKIEVTGRDGASGSVKQNIYVGEEAVSDETTGATTVNSYVIAADYQAAGNVYTLKVTSDHNTQITEIKVYKKASVSISVNANFPGTTYSTDKALDFTNVEGLKAYIITDAKGTTQQVTKVPANTGLYLEVAETAAEKREFEVPVTSEDVEAVEGNLLIPTDGTSVQSDNTITYYAYGKQSGKYAFFKVSTTKAYTPSANKALLAVPTGEAGAKDMIDVNGGATGIEAIDNAQSATDNNGVYNLSGQRVAKAQKGVYIVNGRKVVVK